MKINKDMLLPNLIYNKPVKYTDKIVLYPVTMNDVISFQLLSQSITVSKKSVFHNKKNKKMKNMKFLL